jgi:hypothetical protein
VLTGADAKRFHDLIEFRKKISQCIGNPRFQLDVVFDVKEKDRPVIDLQLFDKVRKNHFKGCDCVTPLTMDVEEFLLWTVEFQSCPFSDCVTGPLLSIIIYYAI